jgi:hypothetical protein
MLHFKISMTEQLNKRIESKYFLSLWFQKDYNPILFVVFSFFFCSRDQKYIGSRVPEEWLNTRGNSGVVKSLIWDNNTSVRQSSIDDVHLLVEGMITQVPTMQKLETMFYYLKKEVLQCPFR